MNKISTQNMGEAQTVQEAPRAISDYRYNRAIQHMILLRSMGEITNNEVKRLLTLLKSPDHENWNIAELAIEEKLA